MKTILMSIIVAFLLIGCSQASSVEKETYNIMVKASEENREMTEEEEEKVKEFTWVVKENKTELERAISAMEMNFYEPTTFEKARKTADELMK